MHLKTVLVILPQLRWGTGPLVERDPVTYAVERLRTIPTPGHAEADRNAVQFVLDAIDDEEISIEDALRGLCAAACKWKDAELWNAAFAKCSESPFPGAIDFTVLEDGFGSLDSNVVLRRSV